MIALRHPQLLILSVSLTLCACSHTHYVYNATDQDLYNVKIYTNRGGVPHGYFEPGVNKAYTGKFTFKPSDPPYVYWTNRRGIGQGTYVTLPKTPGIHDGTHFIISKAGVKAVLQRAGTHSDPTVLP